MCALPLHSPLRVCGRALGKADDPSLTTLTHPLLDTPMHSQTLLGTRILGTILPRPLTPFLPWHCLTPVTVLVCYGVNN